MPVPVGEDAQRALPWDNGRLDVVFKHPISVERPRGGRRCPILKDARNRQGSAARGVYFRPPPGNPGGPRQGIPPHYPAAGAVSGAGPRRTQKSRSSTAPITMIGPAQGQGRSGESLPTTAAREILEETGFSVRLGKLIGKVTYPVQGRTKVVYYWVASTWAEPIPPIVKPMSYGGCPSTKRKTSCPTTLIPR